MARVYGITKRLEQNDIAEKIVKDIIGNGDLVDIVTKMEDMLDPEITYQILDSCACRISLKEIKNLKEIKADSLEDKIRKIPHLKDFHSDWNVRLDHNNTLTAGWIIKKEESKYTCVCSAAVNNGMKVSDLSHANRKMPLTYCFCCAGHCRRHLQKLLGIQLKTKKIISSPINSNGQEPCKFIFEII